jgi:hypothetical protein
MKYSVVLTEMFRFKPASEFVGMYHSVVTCALNMGITSNNFPNSERNEEIFQLF